MDLETIIAHGIFHPAGPARLNEVHHPRMRAKKEAKPTQKVPEAISLFSLLLANVQLLKSKMDELRLHASPAKEAGDCCAHIFT